MNNNQQHKFYRGVELHARTLFTHALDHKGKTVLLPLTASGRGPGDPWKLCPNPADPIPTWQSFF